MAEPDDDDMLDGCELDFAEDPDDEVTAALRAISPTGDKAEVEAFRAAFS